MSRAVSDAIAILDAPEIDGDEDLFAGNIDPGERADKEEDYVRVEKPDVRSESYSSTTCI